MGAVRRKDYPRQQEAREERDEVMLNNKRRLSGSGAGIDLVAIKAELSKERESEKGLIDNNSVNIFANVFSDEDDLIWPLQLVDEYDREQFAVLYPLLRKLPHVVMYYLNELIFPRCLTRDLLSTCGGEPGATSCSTAYRFLGDPE